MALKDNILTARGEEERLRRRRRRPARQVDRPDRAHLPVQERQAEGARTSSTPRSCRRRPSARRTDGATRVARRTASDRVRRARWRQPRLWRRHRRHARGRRPLDRMSSSGEFAAVVGPSGCGKSTLMKLATGLQFPFKGTVQVAGEVGQQAGQDRRHGVPGADPAALAHDAGKPAAAARDRRAAPQPHPPPQGRICRARRERCSPPSGSAARATSFPGNCPAACSSAPRSAAR